MSGILLIERAVNHFIAHKWIAKVKFIFLNTKMNCEDDSAPINEYFTNTKDFVEAFISNI